MQQLAENYHADPAFRRVVPAYVQKCSFYLTVTGELVLLIGNQYLQVSPDEARSVLEGMIHQGHTFSNGSNNHATIA